MNYFLSQKSFVMKYEFKRQNHSSLIIECVEVNRSPSYPSIPYK